MEFSSQKLKKKMLELTQLFCIERSIFQRFVIVYNYIDILNEDALAKDTLQKIFNETIGLTGNLNGETLVKDEMFNKGEIIYTQDFWTYYTNLEFIHDQMQKFKESKSKDNREFENLAKVFSKSYSKEILKLSFKVVNSNIFERLDKTCFFNKPKEKILFDDKRSVLCIKGKKIKINMHDKISNAHKILRYIFITNQDNLTDDFFYSEIAEDEFGDLEYGRDPMTWEKYRDACRKINDKVVKQTQGELTDFLVYNTGKTGHVKVNKEYL